MKLQKPDVVLFDLDGTMVDSVPDLSFSLDATLQELGYPARGVDAARNWVGNGVDRLVRTRREGGCKRLWAAMRYHSLLLLALRTTITLDHAPVQQAMYAIDECLATHASATLLPLTLQLISSRKVMGNRQ